VCCSVLQCVAVCCSVLQCVAVRCSVLQCDTPFVLVTWLIHTWHVSKIICDMEWLRLVGFLKLYVSFAEYRLLYTALFQKRPIILRSLLIVATPCTFLRVWQWLSNLWHNSYTRDIWARLCVIHLFYWWREVCCSVLQCVAVYCSVLQCAAVCCSVLQCDTPFVLVTWLIHTWHVSKIICDALSWGVWQWLSYAWHNSFARDILARLCVSCIYPPNPISHVCSLTGK